MRLVTPGTLTEDGLLDARRHNFLAAYAEVRDGRCAGLGRYLHRGLVVSRPASRIAARAGAGRSGAPELLLPQALGGTCGRLGEDLGAAVTPLAGHALRFDGAGARRLAEVFRVETLGGFGTSAG